MILWVKYVLRENRDTTFYDVGTNWFGNYKIVWNKWFFNRRFVVVRLKKFN